MRYFVHARFLMGDLTFTVEADSEAAARSTATMGPFRETLELAKSIVVYALPSDPIEERDGGDDVQ